MHASANPIGETDRVAATARHPRRGWLTVIQGCMFSGKTTELIRRLDGCPAESAAAFKHAIDTRYAADAIVSHGGKAYPAAAVTDPAEISPRVRDGVRMVAIDEAHFFCKALADVCGELSARGATVVVAMLDRNSWGRPFALARRLAALADETVSQRGVCARCGGVADRTQRLTPIVDGNLVGGPESYAPRCTACWFPPPEPPPD